MVALAGRTLLSATLCAVLVPANEARAQTFELALAFGDTGPQGTNDVVVDPNGDMIVTGVISGTVDFDPGAGTFDLVGSGGGFDAFVARHDASGALVWAINIGTGPGFSEGHGVALDGAGNVFVAGQFGGTADFDPGPGTFELTSTGASVPLFNPDGFLAKYDASGSFLWAIQLGGTMNDEAFDLAVDGAGNATVVGRFAGTADFDGGPGSFDLTSAGSVDAFLARYDSAGNLIGAIRFGGSDFDQANGVTLDASGAATVTGGFGGTADFDPGAATVNRTAVGQTDAFVARYDSSGSLVWAIGVGDATNDFGADVAATDAGVVTVTGVFEGMPDFDPGPGLEVLTSAGQSDVFVARYDASGALIWARAVGSTNVDRAVAVVLDGLASSTVTGFFGDTVDFDPGADSFLLTPGGSEDAFVARYDSFGLFVFAVSAVGADGSAVSGGQGIAIDPLSEEIVTTGRFGGTVDFDPGSGTAGRTGAGGADIFVWKLGSNTPPTCSANGPYLNECAGSTTQLGVDGSGSSDPDPGDSLAFAWQTDCPGGSFDDPTSPTPTLTVDSGCLVECGVTLTVTDESGAGDTCGTDVTVADTTPPVLSCNAPPTITPPDAPIIFAATAQDSCEAGTGVSLTAYDCFALTKKGKRIDKTQSCVVAIDGATLSVLDSGGVGDTITWSGESADSCGNASQVQCTVEVVNPGH
jgi:hypothetical protein